MKRTLFLSLILTVLVFSVSSVSPCSQEGSFTVTADEVLNGSITLVPPLPADGRYPAGAVIKVTAVPDRGYALDSGYFSVPGMWGRTYHESMTGTFSVTVDQDMNIGASFIKGTCVDHVDVIQDVVYAKPGIKTLKYDVYSPRGARALPIIVIIHGGGWISNTEDIMRGMARELTRDGRYVVCSIDYRWAQMLDGDATNNAMADIIGDVYGAVAHIMEHAAEYGGDGTRIALTGDSAGGHLSAAAANMPDRIGRGGFGRTGGVFEFMPSYLPEGKTVDQVREEMMNAIQAAAPSYGVFTGSMLKTYSDDPDADDSWSAAISPQENIPDATDRAVPQYLTRGSNDFLIKDEYVRAYADALKAAGQRVEYDQVAGAGHAFFDWKPDEGTRATFAQYGVPYCKKMEDFFNSVFYPDK